MHILLVDDNTDTRELFSMAFMLDGHRTRTAADGREAIRLVEEHLFDAIVLDVEMSPMSGWEVMAAVRALPFGQRVPIVMFTAYHTLELEVRAKSAGAFMLLRKPTLPASVLQVIEMALSNKPAL